MTNDINLITMRVASSWVFNSLMGTAIIFCTAVFFSCNYDKCRTVNCVNGGVCNAGACTCPAGYEGPLCESECRDIYVGTRQVWDSGNLAGVLQYPISITNGTRVTDMQINHLYNYFTGSLNAFIAANDTIVVPPQSFMGKQVEGRGYTDYNGNVTIHYNVIDNTTLVTDHRTMKWN